MKRDMVNLRDRLSKEIFSRRFVELDQVQQAFVNYHVGGYHTYVKHAAPVIRTALKKRLHKEYAEILELYCRRLPPEYLRAAVDEGVQKAGDNDCVTFAIGWFKDHFTRHGERYQKHAYGQIEGRIDVEVDYPWFYNIFRYIRENDTDLIFEPFWGFRHRTPRRKKRPAELELALKSREVGTVESMIERLQGFNGPYPKRREKIKTLKRRKKRLLQQIEDLREGINAE